MRVLLVGASGAFGSLLARHLAREPGVTIILAARRAEPLEALEAELDADTEIVLLDRERLMPEQLDALAADAVIDAAGPFQGSGYRVIEAAIAAGCHYVDLADGREFVTSVGRFDAAARDAGVVVSSGVSTTPALTCAVVDELTEGWQAVDSLKVHICPGRRAPRGLSVARGVLSYAGRSVRLFDGGEWIKALGWSRSHRIELPELGWRWVSLVETSDLDLMVERYRARRSVEFFAGLQSPLQHLALAGATFLVRWGVLPPLLPFARPLRFLAALMRGWGSDRGGARVDVTGSGPDGQPAAATWTLVAPPGKGQNVPTFAAVALIRRLRDGSGPPPGAGPCVGQLTLGDFEKDFAPMGAKITMARG